MNDELKFKLTADVSADTMCAMYGRVVVLDDGRWFKAFADYEDISQFLDVEEPTEEQCEEFMRGYAESLIEAYLCGDVELELHRPDEGPYGPAFTRWSDEEITAFWGISDEKLKKLRKWADEMINGGGFRRLKPEV